MSDVSVSVRVRDFDAATKVIVDGHEMSLAEWIASVESRFAALGWNHEALVRNTTKRQVQSAP